MNVDELQERALKAKQTLASLRGPGEAVDYFLKVDGIEGSSVDAKHKGEIEIASFDFHEGQIGTSITGAATAPGKVSMNVFRFAADLSKATPRLFLACAKGEILKSAILSCRNKGSDQDYMRLILSEVRVTTFGTGLAVDPEGRTLLHNAFDLSFTRLEFEYKEARPDGSLGGPTKTGWNLKDSKPV